MERISTAERRARLAVRHHLVRPAASVVEAAGAMVGLHSSDPATVYLSARARVAGFTSAHLEEVLYERRTLVRMLGMRRTLFVAALDVAAEMSVACTRALVAGERKRLVGMLEDQHLPDGAERWLDDVCERTVGAIHARGEATAVELTGDVPELGLKLRFGEGKRWEASVGVSTRVLFLLATEGRVVRARPLGGWTSGQYRWAVLEDWLGGGLPSIDEDTAHEALLARYLRAFGPATLTDVRWWTGWTVAATRRALAALGAVEVGLDDGVRDVLADGVGYVLADDLEPPDAPDPWVAFLPGLDATVMGWKERGWYLGEHAGRLFDTNGNAGPTVWADGRVVGGWRQTGTGEIVVGLLEDVGAETREAIDEEAARLGSWLGDARVMPRFRTPLEKGLRS